MWDKTLNFRECKALFDDAYEKKYGLPVGDHVLASRSMTGFQPTDREKAWRLFLMEFLVPNPINSIASLYEVATAKLNAEEMAKRKQDADIQDDDR